jgi:hypothetical protein
LETGKKVAKKSLDNIRINGKYLSSISGALPCVGFQIKYIYFIDPEYKKRLKCKILDYSEIEKAGAKMYKGVRVGGAKVAQSALQPNEGGAVPTSTLQNFE